MRLLLLSTVRTRSSFLLDTLSKYYKLENLYEYYNNIQFKVLDSTFFKKPEVMFDKFKKHTVDYSNQLKRKDNFCLKIHPVSTLNIFKYHHNHTYHGLWNINSVDDFVPLNCFNLGMYDKIFILTRKNYIDLYCSWMHGNSISKLLYGKNESKIRDLHNKPHKIAWDEKIAKILQYDLLFLDLIKNHLPTKDITCLDYDDAVNFVKNNLDNIESKYVDAEFEYKTLITNYDEISEKLRKVEREFPKEFNIELLS